MSLRPPKAACLCLCLLQAAALAGKVTEADFDVAREQIDQTAERLVKLPFSEVARPAAAILGKRESGPAFGTARDWTKEQWEAFYRRMESPAQSVARLVWTNDTREPVSDEVARVLGEIATDRRESDVPTRRVALNVLRMSGLGRGALSEARRAPLNSVVQHGRDDPTLRLDAALGLIYAERADPQDPQDQTGHLLRELPGIVRAQPTLVARVEAFNNVTNIGLRLHALPKDTFGIFVRLGFELIEEMPMEKSSEAYFVARRLGYMLRRPDEFAPSRVGHHDKNGNLAPSFFAETANNARRWWRETGRRALDEIAPEDPRR